MGTSFTQNLGSDSRGRRAHISACRLLGPVSQELASARARASAWPGSTPPSPQTGCSLMARRRTASPRLPRWLPVHMGSPDRQRLLCWWLPLAPASCTGGLGSGPGRSWASRGGTCFQLLNLSSPAADLAQCRGSWGPGSSGTDGGRGAYPNPRGVMRGSRKQSVHPRPPTEELSMRVGHKRATLTHSSPGSIPH